MSVPQHPNSRAAAVLAARQAIEHGDRPAALDLLAAIARGEQEAHDRAALARYEQTRAAGDQVLDLLRSTPWDRSDLARIRTVLDELDQQLIAQEQEPPERAPTMSQSRRRLGRGSLEAKFIRGYGPYLYYRFRAGGRHRSVYVGKARLTSHDG